MRVGISREPSKNSSLAGFHWKDDSDSVFRTLSIQSDSDPRFHCRNARHVPTNIPSKLVDDGICDPDCCDGSSELPSRPDQPPPCANTCRELAAAALAEKIERQKIAKAGAEKRKGWEAGYKERRKKTEKELNEKRGMLEELRRKTEILRGDFRSLLGLLLQVR